MRQAIFALAALLAGAVLAGPGARAADRAGVFDYYVLALSWQPNWCLREGDARGADTCREGAGAGWTLHGLWPQYEDGWPQHCTTTARDPSRAMTGAMADIMGSGGLAWHQWKKHGRCSGLSASGYFEASRDAFEAVAKPDVLRRLEQPVRLPASVIEDAFLEANPQLAGDAITITCRDRMVAEARICLTRDLEPRRCGDDVIRDCTSRDAYFAPLR